MRSAREHPGLQVSLEEREQLFHCRQQQKGSTGPNVCGRRRAQHGLVASPGLCVLLAGDKLKHPGGESVLSLGISKEWGPAGSTSSLCCSLPPGTKGAQAPSQKGRRAFAAEVPRSRP